MFKDNFPDYQQYEDTAHYTKSVPNGLASALSGFIIRFAEDARQLKGIVNDLKSHVPEAPTSNWGWDYLLVDLDDAFRGLASGKFHRFMDAIITVVSNIREYGGKLEIDEINELFEDYDFGYRIVPDWGGKYTWELREPVEKNTEPIKIAGELIGDICEQAMGHLTQLKIQLETGTERALKDAVRDSMSSMESLLKKLTSTKDIKDATSALRISGDWGPEIIVKEGLSIWNRLHDLHPDIRHGVPDSTSLSREEAYYWIDRIMAFMTYIARRRKTISM